MGDMDHEQERAELERKFQKFARENPHHPAVIKAIACRIANQKDEEPCECVRNWLDLALKQPNHPRVLRVRKVVADLAANRERRRENKPVFVEPFRLPLNMENVPWDSQQRLSVRNESSQSLPTAEAEKAGRQLFSTDFSTKGIYWPMKTEHIDASQVATMLSALRFFQENHAFAVERYAEYHFVTQPPLTVEEIDTLCETIVAGALAHIADTDSGSRPDTKTYDTPELKPDQAGEPNPKPAPTPESEKRYEQLSDQDWKMIGADLKEHLRISKVFKLFREMHSGNSTVN